jgi:hypothetical protein
MAQPAEIRRAQALALDHLTGRVSRDDVTSKAATFGIGLPIIGAALTRRDFALTPKPPKCTFQEGSIVRGEEQTS